MRGFIEASIIVAVCVVLFAILLTGAGCTRTCPLPKAGPDYDVTDATWLDASGRPTVGGEVTTKAVRP